MTVNTVGNCMMFCLYFMLCVLWLLKTILFRLGRVGLSDIIADASSNEERRCQLPFFKQVGNCT